MTGIHILVAPFLAAVAYGQAASSTTAASTAGSSAASSGTASSALPNLSSTSAASSAAATTDASSNSLNLPSISQASTSYSYPAPSVPPTANAPFMQKSNLPNGTVFICVGAILGGAFLLMLAWRAWAAWMLHRRMNEANAHYMGVPTGPASGNSPKDKKLRKSTLYQKDLGSEMSLDALSKKDRKHARRSSKMPQDASRQSNLFFSPTAGAGAHGTQQQRASSFLPAGYYAAGGSTVVNANSTSDLSMRTENRLSMADFGTPNRQPSPYKDSPLLRPHSGHGLEPPNLPFARNAGARNSVTSLSGSETNSRAPSAYLEDLFDSTPVKERRSNERDGWR